MGQKVHPYGFRLGINKPWKSRWFVERGYDKLLVEDVKLKAELREKLKAAGVSSVEVERPGNEEDHEEGSDQDRGEARSQDRCKEDSCQEDCSQKGREVSSFL